METMKKISIEAWDQAAAAFADHKILTFPTDTVYGAGVLFGDLDDLNRLKSIKHRPEEKPIPVMVSSLEMMESVVQVTDRERKIVEKLLPGALTLILPLQKDIDPALFNGKTTAAVRIPDAPFILKTIESIGSPLFVTSANVSGEPAALTAEEAARALPDVYAVVDGKCQAMEASTIVDCTREALRILRPGPVTLQEIMDAVV